MTKVLEAKKIEFICNLTVEEYFLTLTQNLDSTYLKLINLTA